MAVGRVYSSMTLRTGYTGEGRVKIEGGEIPKMRFLASLTQLPAFLGLMALFPKRCVKTRGTDNIITQKRYILLISETSLRTCGCALLLMPPKNAIAYLGSLLGTVVWQSIPACQPFLALLFASS